MSEPQQGDIAASMEPATPTLPRDRGACECGWKFGHVITVRWRDRMRDCLVMYGTGARIYKIEMECPACRKLFCFTG